MSTPCSRAAAVELAAKRHQVAQPKSWRAAVRSAVLIARSLRPCAARELRGRAAARRRRVRARRRAHSRCDSGRMSSSASLSARRTSGRAPKRGERFRRRRSRVALSSADCSTPLPERFGSEQPVEIDLAGQRREQRVCASSVAPSRRQRARPPVAPRGVLLLATPASLDRGAARRARLRAQRRAHAPRLLVGRQRRRPRFAIPRVGRRQQLARARETRGARCRTVASLPQEARSRHLTHAARAASASFAPRARARRARAPAPR